MKAIIFYEKNPFYLLDYRNSFTFVPLLQKTTSNGVKNIMHHEKNIPTIEKKALQQARVPLAYGD